MERQDTNAPETFLVATRVRAYIASQGLKMSDEAMDELNLQVRSLVDRALQRTRANKRLTIRPQDF